MKAAPGSLEGRSPKPLLLVRPRIHEHESVQAYLMRVASENGIRGAEEMCKLFRMRYRDMVHTGYENFRRLACGERPPTHAEESSTLNQRRKKVPEATCRTRVCPLCIGERRIPHWTWELPLSVCCEEHGVMLIDRCPKCGAPITHKRWDPWQCNCGQCFGAVTTTSAPAWTRTLLHVFAPWRATEPPNAEWRLREQLAYKALKKFYSGAMEARRMGSYLRGNHGVLWSEHFPEAAGLLDEWPHEFQRRLRLSLDYYAQHGRRAIALKSKIYRTRLPALIECVLQVISEYAPHSTAARKIHTIGRTDGAIYSFEELKSIMCITDQRSLIKLIERGVIRATYTPIGKNKKLRSCYVTEGEANEIRRLYATTLSRDEACEHLHCTAWQLYILSKRGHLPYLQIFDHAKKWRYKAADLDLFYQSLLAIATIPPPGITIMTMSALDELPRRQLQCEVFKVIIHEITRDHLQLFIANGEMVFANMGNMGVSVDDYVRIRKGIVHENNMKYSANKKKRHTIQSDS